MSFQYRQRIPDADAILKQLPVSSGLLEIKKQRDRRSLILLQERVQGSFW